MTLDEKLEIVSRHYADKYIEDVNIKSMVHKAYCEGFKAGYKKAIKSDEEQHSKSCSYYVENDKKPCCTHQCDGCTWYV